MPDFSTKIYRPENFFQEGVKFTTDPLNQFNFTVMITLLMNVTVFNPNRYEIKITSLNIDVSNYYNLYNRDFFYQTSLLLLVVEFLEHQCLLQTQKFHEAKLEVDPQAQKSFLKKLLQCLV